MKNSRNRNLKKMKARMENREKADKWLMPDKEE